MDPLPNTDPLPVRLSHPGGLSGWLKLNGFNFATGLLCAGVVFYYLNPVDVILAAFGLTAIIFLHELGHFAAAKLCKVRVETFSIGFGPALPFCSYKYGETTYKLAMVPLGGFVKMLGEGDAANDEDAEDDPRSFKNQSVGERMFIISAGVVMNVLLGCVLFVVVYMHGLEEKPAVIAVMEPGGGAWREGVHSGAEIKKIGTREDPWFDDIRPVVWGTSKGERLPLVVEYAGKREELTAEPLQEDGAPYPVLGIIPPSRLQLIGPRRADGGPPARVGSPAADAGFRPGDLIAAMTDPAGGVTPAADVFEYQKRLAILAGKPVKFRVRRADGSETAVAVQAAYRKTTGARMRMGQVVAARKGSPAADLVLPGDQITDVEVTAGGVSQLWTADPARAAGKGAKPLDPMRLPSDLNRWADATTGPKRVKLTVLRDVDHTTKPVAVELGWDEVGRFDYSPVGGANSPVAVNGLGLAYHALAVVDGVEPNSPAAAELQPNDRVIAVRFPATDHKGKELPGSWEDLKAHQWAFVDAVLQRQAPFAVGLKVDRGGQTREILLAAADDPTCPAEDRGLLLDEETRVMKAGSVGEALAMGARRTLRSIQGIYINLYAMAFGRVSFYKTVSGPITLARASYIIAGEDVWKLLLLLALISINLAVVNFLPIPVLDGGHMMFLTYEWLRGKPAPESVQTVLTFAGLGVVGVLMLTVVGLDVYRLVLMLLGK